MKFNLKITHKKLECNHNFAGIHCILRVKFSKNCITVSQNMSQTQSLQVAFLHPNTALIILPLDVT